MKTLKRHLVIFLATLIATCFSKRASSQVFYTQNFEGFMSVAIDLPIGFTETTNSTDGGWNTDSSPFASSTWLNYQTPPSGILSNFAFSNDDACNCDKSVDFMILPILNFTGKSGVRLIFDEFLNSNSGGQSTIEVSTDNGLSWAIVHNFAGGSSWIDDSTVPLCQYDGMPSIIIRFTFNDNGAWAYGAGVDDIRLEESSPNLSITPPPTTCSPGTVDITNSWVDLNSSCDSVVISYWTDAACTIPLITPTTVANSGTYYITANGTVNSDTASVSVLIIPGGVGTDVQTACDSYTWIDANTYATSNNTATFTIVGGASNGCDSVVTLNLTINTVDVSVVTVDPIITAIESGANYQWLDCSNNYGIITGETAQNYIASANGDYSVEVTKNGCTDTSVCITIVSIGINENSLFNDVVLYPNPTQGIVNINLGELSDVNIRLLDISGRVIFIEDNIHKTVYQLKIDNAPGVYFLEMIVQDSSRIYKLLKR